MSGLEPLALWSAPLSVIAGACASLGDPSAPEPLVTAALTLGPLAVAWFAIRRWPAIGLALLALATTCLSRDFCRGALADHFGRQPRAEHLNRAYRIEARVLRQWSTPYGSALKLDRIHMLSPNQAPFHLSRLTMYTPELPGAVIPKAKIVAWIQLKRRCPPRPFPWPAQSLRDRFTPYHYGTVKSLKLLELPVAPGAKPEPDPLNRGNRELVDLFFQRTPSPLWRERLKPFGLGHLLAISGLHCVLVFFGLQLLLWPLRRPWRRTALSILGILAFAHWAGWSASVTRASLMLALWRVLPALNRPRSWTRLWAGLLAIALLAEPLNLIRRGFWYSFAASLGLILGARQSENSVLEHPWLKRLRPALPIVAAQMFVIPINLTFDSASPLTGFFWNLLGFAALAILLGLLGLALLGSLAPVLAPAANAVEQGFSWALDQLAFQPQALDLVRFPYQPWTALLTLAIMAVTLAHGRREWRWLMATAALTCLLTVNRPAAGERLVMLDVGQGLCMAYVSASGDAWLFDAGGRLPPGVSLARTARLYGAKRIRAAFISHHDEDHYNLLRQMPASFPIYAPSGQCGRFSRDSGLDAFEIRPMARGATAKLGEISVDALWPPPGAAPPNDNEGSLVLLIRGPDWSVLFTGDAGTWTEQRLPPLDSTPVTALIVGHHGSKTATGMPFLRQISPDFALISCGRDNRFGHPHPRVVANLNKIAATLRVTAQDGSILVVERGKFILKKENDGGAESAPPPATGR